MFSSKFKSWVESHLTRSGKKFKSNSKKNRNRDDRLAAPSPHHFGAPSSTMSSTASSATATASVNNNIVIFHDNDRVTSLPVLNANGRSNAALVIQLQNDIAMNASWNKHNSQLVHSPLISWKRDHHQPSFRNQNNILSPSSVSSLTNGSISSKATSSICTDMQRPSSSEISESLGGNNFTLEQTGRYSHHHRNDHGQTALSSPESAYSTGCSADISPSQDVTLETGHDAIWPSNAMHEVSFSPRPRSSIRTNPWINGRNSNSPLTGSRTSVASVKTIENRRNANADIRNQPCQVIDAQLAHSLLSSVKETDIISDTDSVPQKSSAKLATKPQPSPITNSAVPTKQCHTLVGQRMTGLNPCNSLELLMEGEQLRVITNQVSHAYRSNGAVLNDQHGGGDIDIGATGHYWTESQIDGKYTQLIRETEAILLQLENDELLLTNRSEEVAEAKKSVPAGRNSDGSSATRKSRHYRQQAAHRRSSRNGFSDAQSSSDSESECRVSSSGSRRWKYSSGRSKGRNRSGAINVNHSRSDKSFGGIPHGRSPAHSIDEQPPSPAPPDPCHQKRLLCGERFVAEEQLNRKKYIDQLLAEIWPEDYDYQSKVSKQIKESRSRQPVTTRTRKGSSCPGSPAVFWREPFDYLLRPEGNIRGASDVDEGVYRSKYDPYGNRISENDKYETVGRSQALSRSSRTKSKEDVWIDTLIEQQRLEHEVAFLHQQLMNTANEYLQEHRSETDPFINRSQIVH